MLNCYRLLVLSLLLLSFQSYSQEVRRSTVAVPFTNVFIPYGFDNNDIVEIVVSGILPTLCHQNPRVEIKERSGDTIKLVVYAEKLNSSDMLCFNSMTPYYLPVELGPLDYGSDGKYKIFIEKFFDIENRRSLDQRGYYLQITKSKGRLQNENLYANVEYVYQVGPRTIEISGVHPSTCIDPDIELIGVPNTLGNVISVLPITRKIPGKDCSRQELVPFKIQYEVPKKLTKSEILIHVRKIDGTSVNFIYRQ
ncbi:MAG: hypothetical protein H6621_05320 [Halobacteriovoraceae bacterium]|nr:hypothetical protein [Halobacteriovoraceae bacterium]